MSCEEVRAYLEEGERVGTPPVFGPRLEEHIARCPGCADFRERQRRLQAGFDLVRERTPSIPLSLDQKVLAGYREHIRGLAEVPVQVRRSRRPARRFVVWALAWAPAAAFALAISWAEIAWFTRSHQAAPASAPVGGLPRVRSTGETGPRPRTPAKRARTERTQAKRLAVSTQAERGRLAEPGGSSIVDAGFRGLMYCDELSCGGRMDVIRMRVPAEALGVPLRRPPGNQLVDAEVLVGPDGVARGIRVVE
ncbi:MAG: hypothetical protein J2P13_01735 [Acidobacteria bacterium]|nr:hypothetical protein [Acidobacteriota bacterium]